MSHPIYKLGKAPAKTDERTIQLMEFMSPQKVPKEFYVDVAYPGVPLKMFRNDALGDCVIAARAHDTLRMELVETKRIPTITDKEVETEYFKETGGTDDGLVMLDSLNLWRKRGWKAGGKTLKIALFAEFDTSKPDQLKQIVFGKLGCQLGVDLPLSAQDEIDAGQPWAATSGRGSQPGSWGGHCIYVMGYNATGPVCITWAQKQQMTWGWLAKYADEGYAVLDATDKSRAGKILNIKRLKERLTEVSQ